jgi:hypothetical protein
MQDKSKEQESCGRNNDEGDNCGGDDDGDGDGDDDDDDDDDDDKDTNSNDDDDNINCRTLHLECGEAESVAKREQRLPCSSY